MKKIPKDGFKQHDLVKFGGLSGVVVTTSAPKVSHPLQILVPDAKAVFGFNAAGEFIINTSGAPLIFKLEFVRRPRISLITKLKSWFKRVKVPKEEEKETEKSAAEEVK